jgi:hypothetical protein
MGRTFFVISLSLLISLQLQAQVPYNVRSNSMGSTSVSGTTDIDAIGLNPANIIRQRHGKDGKSYFSIVANGGLQTKSDYLSVDFYNDYLAAENQVLDDQDKQTILNEASDQPSYGIAAFRIFSAVVNAGNPGSFGLAIDETFRGNYVIAKDVFDIALYGNAPSRTYSALGTKVDGYWVREINISYANQIKPGRKSFFDQLSFGVAVKPQFGIYYLETVKNNLSITTNSQNQIFGSGDITFLYSGLTDDIDFKMSTQNSGFGFGFDVGANIGINTIAKNMYLNLGMSITDIGYVEWTKNTANYFYDGNFVVTDITDPDQRDSLKNYLKETKTTVPSFTTSLPTQIRLGGTLRILSGPHNSKDNFEIASISLDYIQGFSENLGGSTKPLVGLGFEYNIGKVVSPRAGFVFGGEVDFLATLGLGIDTGPVIIDIGTGNIASIFSPQSTTKLSVGFGLKFRI